MDSEYLNTLLCKLYTFF